MEDITITNCYSTGNISSSSSYANCGGIAGEVVTGNANTINNCAAINPAIKSTGTYAYAGRIVGNISGSLTISNNFALNTMIATDKAFNTDMAYHGVDKIDAQLRTQITYSGAINGDGLGGLGWKFGNDDANPWKMPDGGGYPILYWQ